MLELDKPQKTSCFSHSLAILLIPFLFITGLVLAYFGIFSLKVEAHTLTIVIFIFIVFSYFVKHNANYAICHMKNSFTHMEEQLHAALRENELTMMGKTKSTLEIKDFIAEYYTDIRNDNFARVAPSVFPMLGILGTFIAIALSMPDFTVQDTGALDREISLLLSGIGTAFYASIYGILLSLLWTYFEKRGMAKVDKQIYDLEKIYKERIWKKSELIKHQHMQSELKDQKIVQTLKETFDMGFIKELNEQYLKNFTSIMHETTSSFTQLTIHMKEASSQLHQTLDRIDDKNESVNAVSIMLENMSSFNINAHNLQKSMNRFDQSVDHTFTMIDKELAQSVQKLTSFTRVVSEQNQLILQNMSSLKKQLKEDK
jgi:biopolymer transport protein ExbB/TolQ